MVFGIVLKGQVPNPIICHSEVKFIICLGEYLENLIKFKMVDIKYKCSTHTRAIPICKVHHTQRVNVFGIVLKVNVQVQCC